MSELTEPEFDVDQQPQEEIDVEEQGNLLRGIVIRTTTGIPHLVRFQLVRSPV